MAIVEKTSAASPRIVVIGAGMSGICLAIRLRQEGFTNVTVYEKSQRPGGTWNYNAYPGSACDVPSFLYSYSFAPNLNWSRRYAPQQEIFDYFQDCVRKFGVEGSIVYGVHVVAADYDESTRRWRVELSTCEVTEADVLVSAVGQLNIPKFPNVPGRESFGGTQFHAARWDNSCELRGKRVAIIGNAATTIQLLLPVAEQAAQVTVFQRSPNYVMAKKDRAYSGLTKGLFRVIPGLAKLYRWNIFWNNEIRFLAFRRQTFISDWFGGIVRWRMRRQVPRESKLISKVVPMNFPAGCKRILLSDDYLQTIQRPNVELVTEKVNAIDATGVQTTAGHRNFDVIIYATGFVSNPLISDIRVAGRGGELLGDAWRERPLAYLGMLTPGFPNFFALYGPNTNLGHNSIIFMVECQVNYLIRTLRWRAQQGATNRGQRSRGRRLS
ncbi:MAG: NAD(P)/FAD-dependent oxidoreductase [Planctomycetaceae bacterium]